MTASNKDTRENQIIRGELFFGSYTEDSIIATGGIAWYGRFTAGTADTHLSLDIETEARTLFQWFLESAPPGGGGPNLGFLQTLTNLNFASANTTSAEVRMDSSLPTVSGSALFTQEFQPSGTPTVSPFNEDSGVVMAAGETYDLVISNLGPRDALYSFNWFLREL